ncbi:MAG TPA: hypothetical protein EYP58_02555 [bacterium (Candidatus Stahlbacteria)]|nr:hypothetical protein [Candidatus Stahlbacteria bacterium]
MTPYLVIILGIFSLITLPLVHRSPFLLILIGAILARSLLFLTVPTLSEDPYRYLWDGEKFYQGENPYKTAPQKKGETRPFFDKIKDQNRPSIYFPLAQIIFLFAFIIKPLSFLGLKILIIVADLITILLLNRDRQDLMKIYLLSPLVLIESYLGLHLDTFLIPLAVGFIIYERKNPLLASTLLSTSLLVRPTLAVLIPAFIYRNRDLRNLIPILGAILLTIPYFTSEASALKIYLRHWEFNASLYYLIKIIFVNHSLYARIISYLIFAVLYPLLLKRKEPYSLILGLFFLCSPTVYPWYLLPLFAISLFTANPLLILCYTSLLSYSVLIPYWNFGIWQENWIMVVAEYLPVYLLMTRHFSVREWLLPSIFRK